MHGMACIESPYGIRTAIITAFKHCAGASVLSRSGIKDP